MAYLIAIVVMVALSAIVALLSFTNIGSGFGDRSAKGEAQKIISVAAEIQAAHDAYIAIHGNKEFEDHNDFIQSVTQARLLRERVVSDSEGVLNTVSIFGGEDISLVLSSDNTRACQYINNQLHGVPMDTEILSCNNDNALTCCEN